MHNLLCAGFFMLLGSWRIELLGGLRLIQAGRVVTRFRTRKAASLLAYLALYASRAHSRDSLADLLWPEADAESARRNLRQALYTLRLQLEPLGVPAGTVLISDADSVRLNPDAIRSDVSEFEEAIQGGENSDPAPLQRAVELYQGPLLPEFYDDWAALERERLAAAHAGALRTLTRHFIAVKNYDRALDAAHRLLAADPSREESYRNLIRIYLALKRPSAAAEQYRQYESMLRSIGAEPTEADRELARHFQGIEPGVSQATAPAVSKLTAQEPPSATTDSARGSLPLVFTRFFGRDCEIEEISDLVRDPANRVVTITGPGGSGKTRISIEAGRKLNPHFGHRVWFVPLADLTDPRLIPGAIREILQLPMSPGQDPLQQLAEYLEPQPALLILDNFEQLVSAGEGVVLSLIRRAPSLTCLITSRRRLRLDGEREFPLSPLPTPDKGRPTYDDLPSVPSVALFADRAQSARPDFHLTAQNLDSVAKLCTRLEGLPLAIELAAARSQMFSPAQLLARIEERFEVLASRRTDKVDRHRSLWAAIDWSFRLLTPEVQGFFARLAVFRGGWTLEAAQEACEAPEAMDFLDRLRTHSLIMLDEIKGVLRFRMLETLREFAGEQLTADESERIAQRHAEWCISLAENAWKLRHDPNAENLRDQLETEHDNLRAALTWLLERDVSSAVRLSGALGIFWYYRGHHVEARRWLETALSKSETEESWDRGRAAHSAGLIALEQTELSEAGGFFREALRLYKKHNDRSGASRILHNLGQIASSQGNFADARRYLEQAMSENLEQGDRVSYAFELDAYGMAAFCEGDIQQAAARCAEALGLMRELNNPWGQGNVLLNLTWIEYARGNLSAAEAYCAQALETHREIESRRGVALAHHYQAYIARKRGDFAPARELIRQAAEAFLALGDRESMAEILEVMAGIAVAEGHGMRAVRWLGAASKVREAVGVPIVAPMRADYEQTLNAAKTLLGEDGFRAAWDEGLRLDSRAAVEEALKDQN